MRYEIPFIKPSFPPSAAVVDDYEKIVASNWYTNFGPYEQKFRVKTAEYIGDNIEVCTVSNATAALSIVTRLLFGSEGDRKNVLVPSFTFAAGPEALVTHGYTPVFLDINTELQPSIQQAREYLEENRHSTAGILLCNIFGTGNTEIALWEELAKDANLPLVIDSAAGFGSLYPDGTRVGSRGDCEIFSLHARKPFAVGEGGLIASRDVALINRCRSMTNFGFGADRQIHYMGENAKLQELNCAIGLRQLEALDTRIESRRNTLERYKRTLSGKGYTFQVNDQLSTVAFASVLAATADDAAAYHELLNSRGVEARRYYTPLHTQAALAKYCIKICDLATTDLIASRIISLPVHDYMDESSIDAIASQA